MSLEQQAGALVLPESFSRIGLIGAWRWHIKEQSIAWSDELRAIFGIDDMTEPPMTLSRFSELVHPDDRARVVATTSATLAGRRARHRHVFRIIRPDGTVRRLLSCAALRCDQAGAPAILDGFDVDVTDLRPDGWGEDAAASVSDLTLLRAILHHSKSYVFAKDAKGRYLFANPYYLDAFGETLEGLRGKTDRERFGDGEVYSVNDAQVLRSGQAIEFEESAVTAEGREIHAISIKFPIRDDQGETVGVGSISTDITDRKRAEKELANSREVLRLALQSGGMGVWDTDLRDGVMHLDAATAAFHGLPAGQGSTLAIEALDGLVAEEDRPALRAARKDAKRSGLFKLEYRAQPAHDAELRWLCSEGVVHYDDARRPIRAVGVTYDVTERRQTEEQLTMLNAELDHRVKNLFGVLRGMIHVSAKGEEDVQAFVGKLTARVDALAAAHTVSIGRRKGGKSDIGALLRAVLLPFVDENTQAVRIAGEAIAVPEHAITPLGLIFNELATNAAKYGALARTQGGIDLSWKRETAELQKPGFVTFTWRERLGEDAGIEERPRSDGFGTRLIARSVAQLRGDVRRDWHSDGLTVTLRLMF